MCELLGMDCNTPTDILFSFTGFSQRGGRTGPHGDGWGLAFYEGKAVRAQRTRTAASTMVAAAALR